MRYKILKRLGYSPEQIELGRDAVCYHVTNNKPQPIDHATAQCSIWPSSTDLFHYVVVQFPQTVPNKPIKKAALLRHSMDSQSVRPTLKPARIVCLILISNALTSYDYHLQHYETYPYRPTRSSLPSVLWIVFSIHRIPLSATWAPMVKLLLFYKCYITPRSIFLEAPNARISCLSSVHFPVLQQIIFQSSHR